MFFQRHLAAATTSLAGVLIAQSQGHKGGSIPPYFFQTAGEHEKVLGSLISPTYGMAYATPGSQAESSPVIPLD